MNELLANKSMIFIVLVLLASLYLLSKSADLLVAKAVKLSEILGIPELIIGATIVSLGTTLPELSASTISALQGNGGFALGNAVGSIITNTSLIIGISALFGFIPVDIKITKKITVFIGVILLLILPTIPYKIGNPDGRIPQWLGFVFLSLIPVYLFLMIKLEKKDNGLKKQEVDKKTDNMFFILFTIAIAAVLIALSATTLVSSAEIIALRIGIPDVIISSTLVAFGTSVPELTTCITAAKKKHGGLALGNVIGANILNVLFVIGVSASLTKGGIIISQSFYFIQFAGLILITAVFGYFAYNKKVNNITKKEGTVLLFFYCIYLFSNFYFAV